MEPTGNSLNPPVDFMREAAWSKKNIRLQFRWQAKDSASTTNPGTSQGHLTCKKVHELISHPPKRRLFVAWDCAWKWRRSSVKNEEQDSCLRFFCNISKFPFVGNINVCNSYEGILPMHPSDYCHYMLLLSLSTRARSHGSFQSKKTGASSPF